MSQDGAICVTAFQTSGKPVFSWRVIRVQHKTITWKWCFAFVLFIHDSIFLLPACKFLILHSLRKSAVAFQCGMCVTTADCFIEAHCDHVRPTAAFVAGFSAECPRLWGCVPNGLLSLNASIFFQSTQSSICCHWMLDTLLNHSPCNHGTLVDWKAPCDILTADHFKGSFVYHSSMKRRKKKCKSWCHAKGEKSP